MSECVLRLRRRHSLYGQPHRAGATPKTGQLHLYHAETMVTHIKVEYMLLMSRSRAALIGSGVLISIWTSPVSSLILSRSPPASLLPITTTTVSNTCGSLHGWRAPGATTPFQPSHTARIVTIDDANILRTMRCLLRTGLFNLILSFSLLSDVATATPRADTPFLPPQIPLNGPSSRPDKLEFVRLNSVLS